MTTTATYNKVKTNIAWMPELPEHWKLSRVKNYFTFSNEVVGEDYSGFNVLSLSVNGVIIRDMESGKGKHSMSMDLYQIVEPKSIILCLFDMDVTPRIVGICENLGIITSAYTTIVPKDNVCERFYYYFFLHQDYNKSLKAQGTGVRTTLTNTQFGAVKIPIPPYQEQIQIANYLDTQSQKINHFIAKKQQFIALLKEQRQSVINEAVTKGINKKVKLKDTDCQFCTQIPENYLIEKFNNYVSIKHGFQFRDGDFTAEGVKIVKISQLNPNGYLDLTNADTISSKRIKEFANIIIKDGDILMALTGGTIGKLIIANTNEEILLQNYRVGNFTVNNEQVLLKEYLYMQLCSPFIQSQINFFVRETGQPNIGKGDFRKLKIVIPPFEEQTQIVNQIKTETVIIDTAIAKTEREIELIKEYKEAMIAEAVMGKVNFNKK